MSNILYLNLFQTVLFTLSFELDHSFVCVLIIPSPFVRNLTLKNASLSYSVSLDWCPGQITFHEI